MASRTSTNPSTSRNLGIRARLLLLLAVPLTALLAVTGLAMYNAVGRSRDAAELSANAQVSLASYRLVDALQAEREVLAAGGAADDGSRGAVADASSALVARAAEQGGDVERAAAHAIQRVRAAEALASTDTGGIVAVDGFSPAIDELLRLARSGFDPGGAIDGRPASTTDLLAEAQEAAAHERDLVGALAGRNALVPDQFGPVSLLASGQIIRSAQAATSAPADLSIRIDRIGDAIAAAARGRNALFFTAGDAAATRAELDGWMKGADSRVSDLQTLRDAAAARAVQAVEDLGASSRTVLLLAAAAVIAVLLISAYLVRSAIRSIARPLKELSTQAEEVATVRLPEAVRSQQTGGVDVHLPTIRASGATEVREVAGAFNDVQSTAVRLAGEQAVLRRNLGEALTNLGRRNQVLLGRQLDFISSLEQRETDPAFLEHLFKLDHLASRMRRNAESLLILTGSETPRRRRTPAPLSEVVRASMSEVEDFERVRLGHLDEATIAGPVVIDLVHMFAELIENALRFSPPDSTVEIDGRPLQGGYQLAVTDHGVGMADVELVAANQRLAGEDEVDGMPVRYLGQYVIAKLAAKTGSLVRLQATAGGRGVTAVVSLPASAILGSRDRASIARPLPGTLAARESGRELYAPGATLTGAVEQPDAVIDPGADPFGEPVPSTVELSEDPAERVSEEWGWVPDVVETTAYDGRGDLQEPLAPADPEPPLSVEAFAADMFAADVFGALPADHAGPPPTPERVPDQEWTVAGPAVAAAPQHGTADPHLDAPWMRGEPTPAAEVAAPLREPAATTGGALGVPQAPGGGLTRRVPGASLQESPLGQAPAAEVEAVDRSADGVRSMLASFQSGRTRGRGGAVQPPSVADLSGGSTPVDPFPAIQPSTVPNPEPPGVPTTSELEETP